MNIDQWLQHELLIQRLASRSMREEVNPKLEALYREVRDIIRLRGLPQTPAQLTAIENAISAAVARQNLWAGTNASLNDFAAYEAQFTANLVASATTATIITPAEAQIQSFVQQALMSLESGQRTQTGTWAQFVKGSTDSVIRDINDAIRTGYARGETIGVLSRRLRDTFERTQTGAEALARTGYSHYANAARAAMIEAQEIELEYVYIATLDSRTTLGCRALDGTKYRRDQDRPSLPRHFNCRSTYGVLPRGAELQGTRAAVGGNTDGTFDPGQVRAQTSHENWLRRQPKWFVEEALGTTRAELFLRGDLDLSRFVDMAGKPLTLAELRDVIDPKIWRDVAGG